MTTAYTCVSRIDEKLSPANVQSGFRIYKVFRLLFVLSSIYSVSGLWLGEEGSSLHWYIIVNTGSTFFLWYIVKLYAFEYISSKKSKKIQIWMYCIVPWSFISRYWGKIAAIRLPVVLRVCFYNIYCKIFNVNKNEIEHSLSTYKSISSFFTRRLKKFARVVATKGCMVVPCDGTVVHCGVLFGKQITQVKGIDYYVNQFLGFTPTLLNSKPDDFDAPTQLFHCVLYLAPGDYHRFHSPCDWTVEKRSYFPGHILSVSPKLARWFPNLLSINERAVYCGKWKHGFFSYSAVGATNVGSIIVKKDPDLSTNEAKKRNDIKYFKSFALKRGEEMGMFNMGSTVVLIFEAPKNFDFKFSMNDKVRVGSQLSILTQPSARLEDFKICECSECDTAYRPENVDIYSVN